MKEIKPLLRQLASKEQNAITKVMAFMSYNPSIGRVLSKGGVEIFQNMAVKKVGKLKEIRNIEEFDRFHKRWVNELIKNIRNNKGKICSVGQAQKPINVFLKVYIDWSGLPSEKVARRLLPFLHVPLDSILMKSISKRVPDIYSKEIKPLRENGNYSFSLSKIKNKEYIAWQNMFRRFNPKKPILFDIIWATERNKIGGV